MSTLLKEDNLKLYDVLTDKHLNQIYKKRPNPCRREVSTMEREVY